MDREQTDDLSQFKMTFIVVHLNVETFKLVLEELDECLKKEEPYKKLLVYEKDSHTTYFITDKHILKDCATHQLARFMYWPKDPEEVNRLAKNLKDFEYEGDVSLLGWPSDPKEFKPPPQNLN